MRISRRRSIPVAVVLVLGALLGAPRLLEAWGAHGHAISGRAAGTNLPAAMPRFFRDASAQLGYLNPEPDRWRDRDMKEMDEAFKYDHYLDMERVPAGALDATDRYEFLAALQRSGIEHPARDVGLLPFRILELYQRLVVDFRNWRAATDPRQRAWIEQRVINDAGILGHYVTDGSNPHHTTVHHNGWAKGFPNPNGYTTDATFHRRFESDFVEARVTLADLTPRMNPNPHRIDAPRAAVLQYLRDSNALLGQLYDLEKQSSFGAQNTDPAHKRFAVDRLAAGANMLRDLWWTAWLESARPEQTGRPQQ